MKIASSMLLMVQGAAAGTQATVADSRKADDWIKQYLSDKQERLNNLRKKLNFELGPEQGELHGSFRADRPSTLVQDAKKVPGVGNWCVVDPDGLIISRWKTQQEAQQAAWPLYKGLAPSSTGATAGARVKKIRAGGPGSGCNPEAGKCGRPGTAIVYPNRPEDRRSYQIDAWHSSKDGIAKLTDSGVFFHTEKGQSRLYGPETKRYRVELKSPKVYSDTDDFLWELEYGKPPYGPEGARLYKAVDDAHAAINYDQDSAVMVKDKGMQAAFYKLDSYVRTTLERQGYDGVLLSPNWNGHSEKGLEPMVEVRKFNMDGIKQLKNIQAEDVFSDPDLMDDTRKKFIKHPKPKVVQYADWARMGDRRPSSVGSTGGTGGAAGPSGGGGGTS